MVGGVGLGLELAEELGQLAPFGMGNPGVRLMVPSARVSDVRTMGEGKHARFSLHSGSHRRSASPSAAPASASRTRTRSMRPYGSRSTTGTARSSRASSCASSTRSRRAGEAARLHPCECDEEEWWSASRPSSAGISRPGPHRGGRRVFFFLPALYRGRRPWRRLGDRDDRRPGLQRRRRARCLRRRLPARRARQRRHRARPLQRRRRTRVACHRCGRESLAGLDGSRRRRSGADRLRGAGGGGRGLAGAFEHL